MQDQVVDWSSKVVECLDKLGGRDSFIPAAKLRAAVARPGSAESTQFTNWLKASGKTFTKLLHDTGLAVHPQAGSDSLVGFKGAALPQPEQSFTLRSDVFSAFTHASPQPYSYIPSLDIFTSDAGNESDRVDIPRITRDDLFAQRRAFVASLTDEEHAKRLSDVLDYSPRALADFSQALAELGLKSRWHAFRSEDIRAAVERWAQSSDTPVSPSWFERRSGKGETAQEVLSHVAHHMTEDEIRSLTIPFRAVEAMYRSLSRRRPQE